MAMRSHETIVKVRFNEVDAYKVAWHGHYVAWMEVGRNELAGEFGLDAETLFSAGYYAPVTSLELKYLKPARFGELLKVRTSPRKVETATIVFETVILGQDGNPVARGTTTHVLTDLAGVIQYRLPANVAEKVAGMIAWGEER
jgi:acyl-CoA thioester hydrolase